jgi:hypothetical protein
MLYCHIALQVGAKVADQPADPATIQDTIIWSSHTFLQAHLQLTEDCPASLQQQQRWEARLQKPQQQQQLEGGNSSSAAANGEASPASEAAVKAAGAAFARAAAAVEAPAGAAKNPNDRQAGGSNDNGNGSTGNIMLSTSGRRDSLVDHLAADETLIAADEAASGGLGGAADAASGAAAPVAHTAQHDLALENASSAELSAAAGQVHLPVQKSEEQQYRERLGAAAYLVAVHTR